MKILVEKAVIEQALEALESCNVGNWSMAFDEFAVVEAITALREALAEQAEQEPVNKALRIAEEALVYHTEQTRPIQKTDETIIYLRNVMAQGVLNMAFTLEDAMAKYPEISYWYNEFLKRNTTADPVRTKDLTDEEIESFVSEHRMADYIYRSQAIAMCRAVIFADREKNK